MYLIDNSFFCSQSLCPFQWYSLNYELPQKFQSKFIALKQPDVTTIRWLERAKMLSSNIWLHLWHALARSVLQFFMTQTDINGLLKRGSMFILSEEQFYKLLDAGGFPKRFVTEKVNAYLLNLILKY